MLIYNDRFWKHKLGLAKEGVFRENNTTELQHSVVFPMRAATKSILNRVPVNQFKPGTPVL